MLHILWYQYLLICLGVILWWISPQSKWIVILALESEQIRDFLVLWGWNLWYGSQPNKWQAWSLSLRSVMSGVGEIFPTDGGNPPLFAICEGHFSHKMAPWHQGSCCIEIKLGFFTNYCSQIWGAQWTPIQHECNIETHRLEVAFVTNPTLICHKQGHIWEPPVCEEYLYHNWKPISHKDSPLEFLITLGHDGLAGHN